MIYSIDAQCANRNGVNLLFLRDGLQQSPEAELYPVSFPDHRQAAVCPKRLCPKGRPNEPKID